MEIRFESFRKTRGDVERCGAKPKERELRTMDQITHTHTNR